MRSARNAGSRGAFGDLASLVRHLPNYQEPATLILLKGHLLVEELLRGYVDRKLPNPSAFKHDQFLFAKILVLCRALSKRQWGQVLLFAPNPLTKQGSPYERSEIRDL